MMYLLIHVVFTVMVSLKSGTINKLILPILTCAGAKGKKSSSSQLQKTTSPK